MSFRFAAALCTLSVMNMQTNTIAQLAVAMPSAIGTLERLGIDYCCNGQQPVAEACRRAGLTTDQLMALIDESAPSAEVRSWDGKSLTEIVRFIVETHHVYTREAMTTLPALASKVRVRHGENHSELQQLDALVQQLAADLFPHMMKEEQVLFPYIEALAAGEMPSSCFGSARNPVRMMMLEHEAVGEILRDIRTITANFTLPEDACTSFRALYAGLAEVESDLHRHIHLENNILFPMAIEAEERLMTATV
jgi:regulator of cell morphogenesis and NO signaling